MPTLLLIALVVVMLGGSGAYYGRSAHWGALQYSGGLLGLILVVAIIHWLMGDVALAVP